MGSLILASLHNQEISIVSLELQYAGEAKLFLRKAAILAKLLQDLTERLCNRSAFGASWTVLFY
jgi:hypothetical protein